MFRGLIDDHSVMSLETDEPPRMEIKLSRADFNARISHAVQLFRDKPLYQFATHLRIASRYLHCALPRDCCLEAFLII